MIRIVQCWDDGVEDDIRLCEELRKFGARATFNLNSGLHRAVRSVCWRYRDRKDVRRLAHGELASVYEGFTIANHTRTHASATRISIDEWQQEVVEGRKQLQDLFGQEISGFAYPFGDFNDATEAIVGEVGHVYARTCRKLTPSFPPQDALALATDCHHAEPDFWERFERAKSVGSPAFYFWGHSYEFETEDDWKSFSDKLQRFAMDPEVVWADLPELFAAAGS
jgi:peptidoglycan/xylan/chitin deacetylase (PgdA/CDA1 family)